MSAEQSRSLGRLLLVRAIYQQLQSRQQLPSLYWWASNAVVQTTVFLSLSSALARMAAALWPGLTSEGPWLLQDLSSPPLYLATLSTPFGTLGSLLPLAIVLTYLRALDAAPSAQVPGILAALRLVALPYYCSALLQPNAVLLGHSATTDVQLLLGLGSFYLGYPTLRGTAAAGGGTRGG
ncbi:uncharacterized protein HaLaN_09239, partial [Haematococcus lacustris]